MNYARLIFEDTPAFIPVPREMQHRKTEIIFLPFDDELSPESFATQQNSVGRNEVPEANKNSNLLLPDAFFESLEKIDEPGSLLELIGKVPACFKSAAEVDAFIRAERDAWED